MVMLSKWLHKQTILQAAILVLFTIIIFFPLHFWQIAFHDITDYTTYKEMVRYITVDQENWVEVANLPAWPFMVVTLTRILSIRIWKAAFFTQMGMQVLLAIALFFYSKKELPDAKPWLHIALPLGIMLAAPVFLIAVKDRLLYFGYIGINSTHNPTIIALKPFVILIFMATTDAFRGEKKPLPMALLTAGLVIFSTLIKPSYIICLLPAAGIFFIKQAVSHQKIDLPFLFFSIALPAMLVLSYQFLLTYGSNENAIIFSPLTVMRNFSGWLLAKFILSIWFPLLASALYFNELLASIPMLIAWLTFTFGALYSYLLAEDGLRIFHGNFVWSGEISLFVLFAVTTFFFFKQQRSNYPPQKWQTVFWIGFLPHIVCGVIYFIYCLMNNFYF